MNKLKHMDDPCADRMRMAKHGGRNRVGETWQAFSTCDVGQNGSTHDERQKPSGGASHVEHAGRRASQRRRKVAGAGGGSKLQECGYVGKAPKAKTRTERAIVRRKYHGTSAVLLLSMPSGAIGPQQGQKSLSSWVSIGSRNRTRAGAGFDPWQFCSFVRLTG